jgi:hypothetical protein
MDGPAGFFLARRKITAPCDRDEKKKCSAHTISSSSYHEEAPDEISMK